MECIFLKLRELVVWLLIFSSAVLALTIAHAESNRELVLVALIDSPIEKLTGRDVRRLYLGVPIQISKEVIIPIRNTSDPLLYEIFLQKVVYLSARDYERQLISRTFRGGGRRPAALDGQEEILKFLRANPTAVTFMWADLATKHQDLKFVKSLWKGSVE